MFDITKATRIAESNFKYNSGAFYGSSKNCSLGVGILYDCIRYPLFNEHDNTYDTVEGIVLVLTHECDLDLNNNRSFNEYVLICPVLPLEIWGEEYISRKGENEFLNVVSDLAADRIYRAFYIPQFDGLPHGGILYFNQICSTHRSFFRKPKCALSVYAQCIVDRKMQNHLFRPKADQLPRLT